MERGYVDTPANRISGPGSRAGPGLRFGQKLEILGAQVARTPLGVDQGSRRIGVDGAVLAADLKKHELGVVIQLQREPVPSNLIRLELVGEKLMVHPGQARHRVAL